MNSIQLGPQASRSSAAALDRLASRFGNNFSAAEIIREQHSQTLGVVPMSRPDAVVFAETLEDVVDAVRICADTRCPIIAHGTGTSAEGQVSAVQGGVALDLNRMNAVIQVNADDFDCRVQPGVTRRQLNAELRHTGLFFPVDPGADASIGGMAATGASGTTTVRYGAMRQNVLGLQLVLANGEVVRVGGRARKSAAGYDLKDLVVGSEGTLGIVTEVILRLHPIPFATAAATCAFRTLGEAVRAATEIMQFGINVARIELVDVNSIRAFNAYRQLGLPEGEYLFLEFHGSDNSVEDDIAAAEEIVERHSVVAFDKARSAEDMDRLWRTRHEATMAALALVPNSWIMATDLCVPVSNLASCIEETKADMDLSGLKYVIAGHVGDGNFHVGMILRRGDADALEVAHGIHDTMVRRALTMEGTCTGEHGIGIGKQQYLELEHGGAVQVMRTLKRAMDPENILNPGKIFSLS